LGYSTTIGATFAAIILVTGLAIMVTSSVSIMDSLTTTLTDQVSHSGERLNERCSLDEWTKIDGNTIRLNVTNEGNSGVSVRDFPNIDVLVVCNSSQLGESLWVPYDQGGGAGSHWRVNRVFFNGDEDEVLNPMKFTSPPYGLWDPRESLEVEIHLNTTSVEFEYVIFILPNGGEALQTRAPESDMGTATVGSGNTSTSVPHGLTVIPLNIQLTPMNDINGTYWVSDVSSSSFKINLSQVQVVDVSFYWLATK